MNKKQNLIIIGGGIMGLMTAFYASDFVQNITILEKLTVPNNYASSFGYTRSFRTDYLDSNYSRFSYEAQLLWKSLQKKSKKQFIIPCGFLNIAKKSITPILSETYAEKSYQNINSINYQPLKFSKNYLKKVFPQIEADMGCLDVKAGFIYLPTVTNLLLKLLKKKNITIEENVEISNISEQNGIVKITTNKKIFYTQKTVITAGRWVNDVLKLINNNHLQFPIYFDKPQECKYIYPSKECAEMFFPKKFPGVAYLDVGIYLHPIFDKRKGAIKIGYYNPPDITRNESKKICSIKNFINECIPSLKNARSEDVKDADQCSYDLVKDDTFILGKLPKYENIFVGAGWRGTGYKFSPLIGKILTQLALQNGTVYDIKTFSPERFVR